ncbi:MAG: hypothetical protein EHM59_04165 [Betaproteobacteria bacterium]|nr:MAG: hypothetical protein EHM59_04165 [Betaproteobacteria bacterium]
MRFEFHDPTGTLEVTQSHAARIDTLAGKRIGFLTNEQWQAHRMLPLLKSLIENDFPGAEVLPIDRFPQGNAEIPTESTTALVKAAEVDAVIVGNAS